MCEIDGDEQQREQLGDQTLGCSLVNDWLVGDSPKSPSSLSLLFLVSRLHVLLGQEASHATDVVFVLWEILDCDTTERSILVAWRG